MQVEVHGYRQVSRTPFSVDPRPKPPALPPWRAGWGAEIAEAFQTASGYGTAAPPSPTFPRKRGEGVRPSHRRSPQIASFRALRSGADTVVQLFKLTCEVRGDFPCTLPPLVAVSARFGLAGAAHAAVAQW
jgi:hypothetical protein